MDKKALASLLLVVVLIACSFLSIFGDADPADWTTEKVDDMDSNSNVAIVMNGSVPHMFYGGPGDDLIHAWKDGSWHTEIVPDTGPGYKYIDAVFDGDNNIHLSYYNGEVMYAYYDGSWSTESIAAEGYATSIDVDSSNNPHICYWDENQQEGRYAYNTTGSWTIETFNTSTAGIDRTGMVVDSNDSPHIVWESSAPDVIYSYISGGSFTSETIEADADDPSIDLDSSGNPHVAYTDGSNNIRYAKKIDSWSKTTIDTRGYLFGTSIQMNVSDNPHIVYGNASYAVFYTVFEDGSWGSETIDETGEPVSPRIALEDAYIHVGYKDKGSNDAMYAYRTPSVTVTDVYVDDDQDSSWYDSTHVHTIQEGVGNVSSGGTVHVWNGTYTENVLVNKTVNITGNGTNSIATASSGIVLNVTSDHVNITGLNISNADIGVWTNASNIKVYHNIFYNNTVQAQDNGTSNSWDNGYPSGGNYWSDYSGSDIYHGVDQDQPGGDGFGDIPRFIKTGGSGAGVTVSQTKDDTFVRGALYDTNITAQVFKTPSGGSQRLTHYRGVYYVDYTTNMDVNVSLWTVESSEMVVSHDFHRTGMKFVSDGTYNQYPYTFVPGTRLTEWKDLTIGDSSDGEGWVGKLCWCNADFNVTLSADTNYVLVFADPVGDQYSHSCQMGTGYTYTSPGGDYDDGYSLYSRDDGDTWYSQIIRISDLPPDSRWISYDHAFELSFTGDASSSSRDQYPFYYEEDTFDGNRHPYADFTFSPSDPNPGESVSFTDESYDDDGSISSWNWEFGDGATSSSQNPSHTYSDTGTYEVNLTVTDNDGETDNVTKNIAVSPDDPGSYVPSASFQFSTSDLNVTFTDTSSDPDGSIVNWTWSFGDNNHSYSQNPTHWYQNGAVYHVVRLIVRDDDGYTDSITKGVYLHGYADFTYSPKNPSVGDTVFFTGRSSGQMYISGRSWSFGDGSQARGKNPTHIYSSPGTYTVSLTASYSGTDSHSTSIEVTEEDNGGGDIQAAFTYTADGTTVHFTDMSQSAYPIEAYSWEFGDGGSSSMENPSHTYSEKGNYTVSLTVTDSQGNSDSETRTISLEEDEVVIPPTPPPERPYIPYTIPEMYRLIGLGSDGQTQTQAGSVRVAVIDTGSTGRMYTVNNDTSMDMSNINMRHVSKYASGVDENGHGTFVTSEVYYASRFLPHLEVYSIKALNRGGRGTMQDIQDAVDIARNLDVDVVSMSFGTTSSLGGGLDELVRDLAQDGIIVVAAAGNMGPSSSTIVSPALSPRAIATGSIYPYNLTLTVDDQVTRWSSRGPVIGLDEAKPDLVSGGESIVGPTHTGEVVWSGTSLSAPVVAGGVGYMLADNSQAVGWLETLYWWNPGLKQKLVEQSLEDSCTKLTEGTANDYGHGLPDIPAASQDLHGELMYHIYIMIAGYIALVAGIIGGVYGAYRYWKKRR